MRTRERHRNSSTQERPRAAPSWACRPVRAQGIQDASRVNALRRAPTCPQSLTSPAVLAIADYLAGQRSSGPAGSRGHSGQRSSGPCQQTQQQRLLASASVHQVSSPHVRVSSTSAFEVVRWGEFPPTHANARGAHAHVPARPRAFRLPYGSASSHTDVSGSGGGRTGGGAAGGGAHAGACEDAPPAPNGSGSGAAVSVSALAAVVRSVGRACTCVAFAHVAACCPRARERSVPAQAPRPSHP
jgi:hypothetical protein